jgi:K+-transporting ATPase ATPase A chain
MEGKEVRFGIVASALFAVVTTAASCGAVNAMHDSFTALGGMIPLINIELGEIVVGGVGSGMYGMLLFVIIAIFVAGLMVGRTPEYVGKKIEAKEVKMAMLAILILPLMFLGWTAVAMLVPSAVAAMNIRDRTASPKSSMRTLRRRATTARRSPGSAPTRCSTI